MCSSDLGSPAQLAADPDSRYSRWIVEQRSAEADDRPGPEAPPAPGAQPTPGARPAPEAAPSASARPTATPAPAASPTVQEVLR